MKDKPAGIFVAHVTVSEPPDSVVTLADWLVWRKAEDERMEAEMIRQRNAFFEGMAEIADRDANNETVQ